MAIDDSLLERNDGVVGDRNVLRTHLGAALGDVAIANAVTFLELVPAVEDVERMHLELRRVDEQARSHELLVEMVIAQDMTYVLAKEALDAFPEFLDPVRIRLSHAPGAIGRIRRPRREFPDSLLRPEVRGNVGNEILDRRKGAHRFYRHRLVQIELTQARHAHQPRIAVYLRRA